MFCKKLLRFLCCLFSVLLFFGTFGVGAFAGSDDLSFVEDTDLRNWEIEGDGVISCYSDIYCFRLYGSKLGDGVNTVYVHSLVGYDDTTIKSGNSYTVKFVIPSYQTIQPIFHPNFTEEQYYSQFPDESNQICFNIGLGFLGDDGSFEYYPDYYVSLTKPDMLKYADKEYTYTFELKDFKGSQPLFGISFVTVNSLENNWLYIKQPVFIDESQAEEDGFFSRLFSWFEEKFEDLKEWFKSLFVPSDEALTEFKDNVNDLFSEHLGFVYTAFDFVKQLYSVLKDIFSSSSSQAFKFTLPALEFDFLSQHIKLWDDITLSFDFLQKIEGLSLMYSIYKACLHISFMLSLVYYAQHVYEEVLKV